MLFTYSIDTHTTAHVAEVASWSVYTSKHKRGSVPLQRRPM